ncbi:helix-turn-helix domain-containing protein [Solihabitans fulvus]|uniref:Helix-turn-helix domain-containing protein n=1 Tax=Solihabitans fulvus TaxID=1892852 RepID=A0A5B2X6Q8_9PSEU|nr:helix-turn-helix transcriptional regulator [Solihabitans fulvus]KAA2258811.1 helix-turn-helix domain-containing protein [Solihabitans fulvus]
MPAVQTRQKLKLGQFLAELRRRAGKGESDFKSVTGKSQAALSKIENGHLLPSALDLNRLLLLYGATDVEHEHAQELWDDASAPNTRIVHPSAYTKEARSYARQEREAVYVRAVESLVIPGLLQTPDYAVAVRMAAHRFANPSVDMEQALAARKSRQRRLDGPDALRLRALVDEAALRRVVGGPQVMRAQLLHLVDRGRQSNITIQAVPFGTGAYGTMSGGGATLLSFGDKGDPDALYLEYHGGGKWVDNKVQREQFAAYFDDMASGVALAPAETETLALRLAEDLKEP